MAIFSPKSKKDESAAYVWVLLDHGGEFKAVCVKAKSVREALGVDAMSKILTQSRASFMKSMSKSPILDVGGSPIIKPN